MSTPESGQPNTSHLTEHAGQAATGREARRTWRCYFCDEVFTTPGAAADHFGASLMDKPGCLIDFQVATEEGGKPERGRGLLMALRKSQLELDAYRHEDTELHRYVHRLQCEHRTALMREEEKGYARGLRDGANLPYQSEDRTAIAAATGSQP